MEYVLAGFRQVDNVRLYYFDARGENLKPGQQATVSADLNLVRKYKIPLQELPLLCRRLLDLRADVETIVFSEPDMVRYVSERAAAQAALKEKRKAHSPQASDHSGQA
jgi:hypothetical protein